MTCQHESAYTIDASRVTFGEGALREVGERLRQYAGERVALVTDPRAGEWTWHPQVLESLTSAGFDVVEFNDVEVEPTDRSMQAAVEWARDAEPDLFVSLGGGSVIDTAKVANLLSTHDGELIDYVNAPLGGARPVPGPLKPHLALPTTSGTGSEVTGIAIFDLLDIHAKSGISSAALRPTEAIVDPAVTETLPPAVVASSGLDVLCHALESLTARPFTARPVSSPATSRPASQGHNPWSDLGCREALTLIGRHLRDAVAGDPHARHQMMWAATLAGIAFGNAGVHVPHAMAYAVAGRIHDTSSYRPEGYPGDEALVPHGFAVAVNAPAAFRLLAETSPERHLEGARLLAPAHIADAAPSEAGEVLSETLATLMRDVGAPNGLSGVGYTTDDIPGLVEGASPQRRLLDNAPAPIHDDELTQIFEQAVSIW
ncbi:hydroxyacid-oxoacid transhydrogenase [Nocardioides sp. Kera G14]|uniref:hydroxyacid-oxoacid transhydrogenase n=1 Tax=Nocardioides sp. Kera G14 TaxID=2884264 RepID=UPI001D0FAB36|nr:hydroxyacid-oxoacid transhydrogenase [Nocardioides sp. Kera G14]UDY23285.1 iron-containing alcohol dehydrogenase [Nocardioides sp. Kera G14]